MTHALPRTKMALIVVVVYGDERSVGSMPSPLRDMTALLLPTTKPTGC